MTDLYPRWVIGDLDLTDYPFAVVQDGIDHGLPDVTVDVLTSFLSSGDIESITHRGNRTITLPLLIEGPDMVALSQAAAALDFEARKPLNTLYHDPGDGFGEPFQFTVFPAVVTPQRNEDFEKAGYRLFTVTWRALSWAEGATQTAVATLPPSGSTDTSVDTMSSTTGWTGTVDGVAVTPATAGGKVSVTGASGSKVVTATRTGTIDTSTLKYLVIDWRGASGNVIRNFTATADGVPLKKIAAAPSGKQSFTATWFEVPAASVAAITFTMTLDPQSIDAPAALTMDNLDKTDIRPTLGSAMQQVRSLDIAGSMPTVGSIAIEHASSSLGDVLVYTFPDDGPYAPACRTAYFVSGSGTTSDAAAISGFHDVISTGATVLDVLTEALPDGEYVPIMRARQSASTGTATLSMTVTPRLNSTDLAAGSTTTAAVATTTTYTFYRLPMLHLPSLAAAPGASSVNRFSITATSASTIWLDELLLFNVSTGRLSQFALGTGSPAAGGPSNRLWIDSPTPANDGLGRLLRGFAADRSDAFSAWPNAVSPTVHEFPAGPLKVFTVATNPTTPVDVSYLYRPAGHSSIYSGQ